MRDQRIVLIRHGETEWTVSGRHTGLTDIPLTESGRTAASQLATALGQMTFAKVLTSPLARACETCELAGLGERAEIDNDLVEWNYGDYEGLTREQILAKAPGWIVFNDGCPGGESTAQIAARADREIAKIRSLDGDVALFAHGHFFRVLAARWIGLPVSAGANFLLDTSTVSVLGHYHGIPAVQCWNLTLRNTEFGHLII